MGTLVLCIVVGGGLYIVYEWSDAILKKYKKDNGLN